jgi:hypothetical protein
MIIGDDRGKDVDYSFFGLMGVPVQVHRREHRVARFVASYHVIRFNDAHDELQKDRIDCSFVGKQFVVVVMKNLFVFVGEQLLYYLLVL